MMYSGELHVGDVIRLYAPGISSLGRADGTVAVVNNETGTAQVDTQAVYHWNIATRPDGTWGADGATGHITLISCPHDKKANVTKTKKKELVLCETKFYRKSGKQILSFKINEVFEKAFEAGAVKASTVYKDIKKNPLSYYQLSPETTKLLKSYTNYYDRVILTQYGSKLFDEGRVNLSLVRTVGASQGIQILVDGLIVETEFNTWAEALARFMRFFYEEYIAPKTIVSKVTLEVDSD